MAVLEEFVERSPEHGGAPYGLYLAIHRHRRAGRGRGSGGSGTKRR